MAQELVFTKKVARSGQGYLVWVPKDISTFLSLDENSYCDLRIKSMTSGSRQLCFIKRIAKSGRGLLVWIPKDITEFLELTDDSVVQMSLVKLQRGGEE